MWDSIEKIFTWLEKSFDLYKQYQNRFDESEKNIVAHNLFMSYIHINKIIITADQIIEVLECFTKINPDELIEEYGLKKINCPCAYSSSTGEYGVGIGRLLSSQIINIESYLSNIEGMINELIIIDNEFYREITNELHFKYGRLRHLLLQLKYSSIPLELNETRNKNNNDLNEGIIIFNEKNKQIVQNYLSTHNPKKKLDLCADKTNIFKSNLEKIFSISDILLDIRTNNINKNKKT